MAARPAPHRDKVLALCRRRAPRVRASAPAAVSFTSTVRNVACADERLRVDVSSRRRRYQVGMSDPVPADAALFYDHEVAEIGSRLRGAFRPENK